MQGHSVLAIPFVVFSLKIIAMKKRILALAIISSVCWCSTATAQHKGNSTSNSGREAVTPRTDFEREPTRRGEVIGVVQMMLSLARVQVAMRQMPPRQAPATQAPHAEDETHPGGQQRHLRKLLRLRQIAWTRGRSNF